MKNSKNYSTWRLPHGSDSLKMETDQKIRRALEYGTLAPSTHNTQPWKLSIRGNTVTVKPDAARRLPAADPTESGMYFSLGCFLLNVIVSAENFGLGTIHFIESNSDGRAAIKLEFSEARIANPSIPLKAITSRQSHKLPFAKAEIDATVVSQIEGLRYGAAALCQSREYETIAAVSEMHFGATMAFAKNHTFSREVGGWMRTNGTRAEDGMPGFAFGLPAPVAVLAKSLTMLTPKSVGVVAKKDKAAIMTAAGVGFVGVQNENPEAWINAGMLYQHAGLLLAQKGIMFAPKAAIIQAGLGKDLAILFDSKLIPQLYFAYGVSDGIPRHTPRRHIDKVVEVDS